MGKFLHPKKSSCNVETLTMERLFRHRVSSCNAGANLLTSAWLGQERDSWVTSLYKRIQSRNRRKYEERLSSYRSTILHAIIIPLGLHFTIQNSFPANPC